MTFQFEDAKEKIELAMEITGLEVTPLARKAGLSGTTLSRFTNRKATSNISVTTIEKLDEAVRHHVESKAATPQQAQLYYSEYVDQAGMAAHQPHSLINERSTTYISPKLKLVKSDRAGSAPEQASGLDAELLETVVLTVNGFLEERGVSLSPEKHWLVYMTCYRILFKSREESASNPSSSAPMQELQDVLTLATK